MYYIGDIGFELKYNLKDKISYFPEKEKYEKFILTYTNIDKIQIENMDQEIKYEIVSFIYSKLNLSSAKTFLESCINISNKVSEDIRYFLIQLLSIKEYYKLSDIYEWDYNKLLTIFYFETLKDEKIKKIFYDFLPKYYTKEEDQEFLKYFTKIFGELKIEQTVSREQEDLIAKLNNL